MISHREASAPVLIFTIANGAGHTRAAEAVAEAIRAETGDVSSAMVIDVANHMSRTARFTHVTAYLWMVKHAPTLWDRIDRYQKKQLHTSPEWYYRRGCSQLFQLVKDLRPMALVATEVGCCEIAALIKRDLRLDIPLVAIDVNYDADRAWVQPEVDLYCVPNDEVRAELSSLSAPCDKIVVWGVPMSNDFVKPMTRDAARDQICEWLKLDPRQPIVLVAGGGEGIGPIEDVARRLTSLDSSRCQIVVLTGRNRRLLNRVKNLNHHRLRALAWTERIAVLMRAADLMVSKLGNTFDEAIAAELPLVSLEPPPGSERVQYRLLREWQLGRSVETIDEMVDSVTSLLLNKSELEAMRGRARRRQSCDAACNIARWLAAKSNRALERAPSKRAFALA